MLGQFIAEQTVDNRLAALFARAVTAITLECRHTHCLGGEPDERRTKNDDGEGLVEKENANEGGRREANQRLVLEGTPADPDHGLDDDGEHGGLEAEEQRR